MSDHGEEKARRWVQLGEAVEASGTEFICPFCKGRAMAMEEPQGVMHIEPVCDTFLALDPVEYLHAVNQYKAREN